MKKMRVLITAGPTREYLDPIRYISNDSSGRMGFALAAAAKKLGAHVTLIAGPVSLETPHGITRINVVSAAQMYRQVLKYAKKADVIIMAAAVSDYRPTRMAKQKIKKAILRSHDLTIPLKETPDILAELGKKKRPDQLLAGFALETRDLERHARQKLHNKKCDWIIANRHTVISKEKGHAIMISKAGRRIVLPELPKEELAFVMLSHLLAYNSPQRHREHRDIF